ncbi:hypothetical protein [Pseudidiomarina aquimaris]|uniref:hypothetical protein n=1 Tax=Pseudidiomarina aquimaris TaxID=641841 RepID=UPI003A970490
MKTAQFGGVDRLIQGCHRKRAGPVLHCIEGMRHEDVASELGIAVGAGNTSASGTDFVGGVVEP